MCCSSVSVIDGATNGVTPVTVGTNPDGVGVNPATGNIYVANNGSNTVSVIYDPPVPTTTGLSPDHKTAGGSGFTLTVNGTGFIMSSVVRWKGADRTTTYVSDTQLTASIPATDIQTAGTAQVTVFTPGAGESNAQTFTINQKASSTFYFAEGYTGAGFDEWLCLMNPGTSATTAHITYMFPDGTTKKQDVEVGATTRTTVKVNDIVGPGRDVSVQITSDGPIVAERPMYFNYNGVWTGGHDVIGATAPRPNSTSWKATPEKASTSGSA